MKYLLFASALLVATALADDRLRDAQAELKKQGFFYGAVDGKDGAETSAAIRRFQIRNGLKVTGTIDDETLAALGMGPANPAPPPETKPAKKKPADQLNPPAPGETRPPSSERPPSPRGKDLLRENPDTLQPSDPDDGTYRPLKPRIVPEDPNVITPPRGMPSPTVDDWSTFFHGTPYASAPREVQVDVLRKAQDALGRRHLYRGDLDGRPGTGLSEALFLYQEQRRLSRTGRLDLATLSDLNLLPGRGPEAPPLKPFYNPNHRRDPSVDLRGVIR